MTFNGYVKNMVDIDLDSQMKMQKKVPQTASTGPSSRGSCPGLVWYNAKKDRVKNGQKLSKTFFFVIKKMVKTSEKGSNQSTTVNKGQNGIKQLKRLKGQKRTKRWKRSKMVKNGQKCSTTVNNGQYGQKQSRKGQHCQNGQKLYLLYALYFLYCL